MRKVRISLVISLALVVAWSALTVPVTITVTDGGSWLPIMDGDDLKGGAGTDFVDSFESTTAQITLKVDDTGGNSWTVNISRDKESWPSEVGLYAQRTDVDHPNYQEVTDTDGPSFSGSKNTAGITVQLKFMGISVVDGPSTYGTTVYYTVTA